MQRRRFPREKVCIPCYFYPDVDTAVPSVMLDFSQMGALIKTKILFLNKKFISILYQNEKNEVLRISCAIRHVRKQDEEYFYGLQFISIEGRDRV